MITEQIAQDLKQALLAGDTERVTVLRGLKTAITYAEVAMGKKGVGLSDEEILGIFQKEVKKRQDSVDAYTKAGSPERAEQEAREQAIIQKYLPQQLSEAAVSELIDAAIVATGASSVRDMGRVISVVKQKAGASADGSMIARLAKQRLEEQAA